MAGGLLPTIMNAANEAAIDLFLARKIRFTDLTKLIFKIVEEADNLDSPDLETIQSANLDTYNKVIKDYKIIL